MKGKQHVYVASNKIKYDITIIKGDSGTGKTRLINLIELATSSSKSRLVKFESTKPCLAISRKDDNWRITIKNHPGYIIFIEEDTIPVESKEFKEVIDGADNYFVIVTRYPLYNIPYSINEIYKLSSKGEANRVFNELTSAYSKYYSKNRKLKPVILVTEDAKSGNNFFNAVCNKSITIEKCISSFGNAGLIEIADKESNGKKTMAIADGAAFGAYMDKAMDIMSRNNNLSLYAPESFEYLLLDSGIFNEDKLKKILESPSDYIDSKEFLSWELFFTYMIHKITTASSKIDKWGYDKGRLKPVYTSELVVKAVLHRIEGIDFGINN